MEGVILRGETGLEWAFPRQADGYVFGEMCLNGELLEGPPKDGFLVLRSRDTGEERSLPASTVEQRTDATAHFAGGEEIDGVSFSFRVTVSLPEGLQAARLSYEFAVDRHLSGWEVGLPCPVAGGAGWTCHLYPFAEDAKSVAVGRLTYVGVPAALLYRDDMSLAVLFGFELSFDWLNPTTWTGDCGFAFTEGVVPAQFRVGAGALESGVTYGWPLQLIFSDAGCGVKAVTSLVKQWVRLNEFAVEQLHVRSPEEALELFISGRRQTGLWQTGIGYKLEEGDPESNFAYMGEQPLSAYFEYLLFEMTGDPLWRRRCFEQMDFVLGAQDTDPSSVHYGAMHTAFDLGKRAFDSDDRGRNVGYKPDLNVYMARYMLETWKRVRDHEGIDRQEWRQAALRAVDWAMRQRNPDGGLPQRVATGSGTGWDAEAGRKSMSSTPGRALPALPAIHRITGEPRHGASAEQLERHTRECVEGPLRFTGHHPDLPPDELEEASIWGVIEYWLDKYERTRDPECLERATADAHLAFLWSCPKQLSWVSNPTQCAAAEQQHFLQYSIYCYQNRKVECLWRLHEYTGDTFFRDLYERVLQGIFWTQVTEGDLMGATHERVADPWLARADYGVPADFDSMGTVYMGEQSLDCMLQILEMQSGRGTGGNLATSRDPRP
jgi:hypothetical protein